MTDYASFLYNAFAGPGQAVADRRQESRANMQDDRNYAAQMDKFGWQKETDQRNFDYQGTRDKVGDSHWEKDFTQKDNYNNRYLGIMSQKVANGGEGGGYGKTPVWGTDAEGNPSFIQLGGNGTPIQPQMPDGFKVARDPVKMDAGTEWVMLDPQTRQVVSRIPKDVGGEERAKVEGKALGDANVSLPKSIAQGENMLTSIKAVQDDPYRGRGTGLSSVLNAVPATGGYDFQQKVDQLKGQSFLQAFESLKGAGQITEVEGQKATQAIARLNTSQSEEAFGQALTDLQTVVQAGMDRARQRASGQQPQGADDGWTTMSNGVKMRQVR